MDPGVLELYQTLLSRSPPGNTGQLAQAAPDPLLGYKKRSELFPGEDKYFKENPHVAGMAAETGDVILNPYSPPGVNHDAVAKNEAMRLYMRDNAVIPSFDVTPQQRQQFVGTAYGSDDDALRQTIAARIYSGDPSANATIEQQAYTSELLKQIMSRRK